MAKLTFVLEDGQEIVVPLAERITLGRGDDNDVVVDDERISKRHAELVLNADGSVQLFDSDSTAGTFVNGERVRSQTIRHGDRLTFGPLAAVLNLEDAPVNGRADVPAQAPSQAGKIGMRKKGRGGRRSGMIDGPTARPPDEVEARQARLQEEVARAETEKARLKAEEEITRRQTALREELTRLEAEKTRKQAEMSAAEKEFEDWKQKADKERQLLNSRVEALHKAEERLVPVQAAAQQAEAVHGEWIKAIKDLAAQHEEKSAALQRLLSQLEQKGADLQQLNDNEAAVRHEIDSVTAHRDQAIVHLQQVRDECLRDEAVLGDWRRQLAEIEQRCQDARELAEAREDQVKTAEKKLDTMSQRRLQLEANIKELTGTEERLTQALARCQEAETRQTELTAAVATLTQEHQRAEAAAADLQSRVAAMQAHHQQITITTEEARTLQQRAEASLNTVREGLLAREKEMAAETKRLEETQARRAEIEQQCRDLAATEQKLADMRAQLAAVEKERSELKAVIGEYETKVAVLETAVKELQGEEAAAEGRLEVLRAREKDLRDELTRLATAERTERTRFEEVRQLADEAEKNHADQKQQLSTRLDEMRRSLADMVSKLTPLREWKDAMDQLYGRLAALPQDSPEARTLWHEIEKEKAGLVDLINNARSQGRADTSEKPRVATSAVSVRTSDKAGAGTGSMMLPGAAQETTLRSRLNHLRENVQREETRLEQLRVERTRQESHGRANPAAEAMMREQVRQLEAKIRQDEERHHALMRTIEVSQGEEEKRRERLADMERKLAELRTDITEAERVRSDLRQQADLVQTELKNREAALDRVLKKTAEAGAET